MPTQQDLLALIRKGLEPQEIIRRMALRPSHLKRMLAGKRLRTTLAMEEQLAAALAIHEIVRGAVGAVGRFRDLMESESPETVRKVCVAVLHESFRRCPVRRSAKPNATSAQWAMLDELGPEEPERPGHRPSLESPELNGRHTSSADRHV